MGPVRKGNAPLELGEWDQKGRSAYAMRTSSLMREKGSGQAWVCDLLCEVVRCLQKQQKKLRSSHWQETSKNVSGRNGVLVTEVTRPCSSRGDSTNSLPWKLTVHEDRRNQLILYWQFSSTPQFFAWLWKEQTAEKNQLKIFQME